MMKLKETKQVTGGELQKVASELERKNTEYQEWQQLILNKQKKIKENEERISILKLKADTPEELEELKNLITENESLKQQIEFNKKQEQAAFKQVMEKNTAYAAVLNEIEQLEDEIDDLENFEKPRLKAQLKGDENMLKQQKDGTANFVYYKGCVKELKELLKKVDAQIKEKQKRLTHLRGDASRN